MAQYTEMVKPGAGLVNVAKREVQKRLDEGWTIYADRNKKTEAMPESTIETSTTILESDDEEPVEEESKTDNRRNRRGR